MRDGQTDRQTDRDHYYTQLLPDLERKKEKLKGLASCLQFF